MSIQTLFYLIWKCLLRNHIVKQNSQFPWFSSTWWLVVSWPVLLVTEFSSLVIINKKNWSCYITSFSGYNVRIRAHFVYSSSFKACLHYVRIEPSSCSGHRGQKPSSVFCSNLFICRGQYIYIHQVDESHFT